MLDKVRASKDSGFILKVISGFFCVESAFLIFKVSCGMLFLKLVFFIRMMAFSESELCQQAGFFLCLLA
jgi:hypothetical protein